MGNGAATAAAATQAREVGEPKGAERGKDGAKGGQQNAPPVRLSEAQRGASRGSTGAQTKHAPGDRGVASKPPGRGGAATPMKSAAAGSKYKPSTDGKQTPTPGKFRPGPPATAPPSKTPTRGRKPAPQHHSRRASQPHQQQRQLHKGGSSAFLGLSSDEESSLEGDTHTALHTTLRRGPAAPQRPASSSTWKQPSISSDEESESLEALSPGPPTTATTVAGTVGAEAKHAVDDWLLNSDDEDQDSAEMEAKGSGGTTPVNVRQGGSGLVKGLKYQISPDTPTPVKTAPTHDGTTTPTATVANSMMDDWLNNSDDDDDDEDEDDGIGMTTPAAAKQEPVNKAARPPQSNDPVLSGASASLFTTDSSIDEDEDEDEDDQIGASGVYDWCAMDSGRVSSASSPQPVAKSQQQAFLDSDEEDEDEEVHNGTSLLSVPSGGVRTAASPHQQHQSHQSQAMQQPRTPSTPSTAASVASKRKPSTDSFGSAASAFGLGSPVPRARAPRPTKPPVTTPGGGPRHPMTSPGPRGPRGPHPRIAARPVGGVPRGGPSIPVRPIGGGGPPGRGMYRPARPTGTTPNGKHLSTGQRLGPGRGPRGAMSPGSGVGPSRGPGASLRPTPIAIDEGSPLVGGGGVGDFSYQPSSASSHRHPTAPPQPSPGARSHAAPTLTLGIGSGPSPSAEGAMTPLQDTGPGTPSAFASPATPHKPFVKDTHQVKRKHQSLPPQMEHKMPTSGNWTKNRYIVNNYILLDILGAGSYAEVRLAKERVTDKLFAVKVINRCMKNKIAAKKNAQTLEEVRREIAIMKKLNHPHVLRLYEVMDDPKVNKLYLVLEYMKGGDLMQHQQGNSKTYSCEPMSDQLVCRVLGQVAQGLKYLHSQNIVHGDIKPQNILLYKKPIESGTVKIADFGISKTVRMDEETLQETAGTPAFMCPEICAGEEYNGYQADVWALGATMYMLRYGRPPFIASRVVQLAFKIINEAVEWPFAIDADVRALLGTMLEKDPKERATLPNVLVQVLAMKRTQKPNAPQEPTTPATYQPISVSSDEMYQSINMNTITQRNHQALLGEGSGVGAGDDAASGGGKVMTPNEQARRTASFRKKHSGGRSGGGGGGLGGATQLTSSSLFDSKGSVDTYTEDGESESEDESEGGGDDDDDDDVSNLDDEGNFDQVMDTLSAQPRTPLRKRAHTVIRDINLAGKTFKCRKDLTNPAAGLSSAWHSVKGGRDSQEDRVTVIPDMGVIASHDARRFEKYSFFGMFDGHTGSQCASELQHTFHMALVEDPSFPDHPVEAIMDSCKRVDAEVCAKLSRAGENCGSTACVVVVDMVRRRLVVGNVGDCRCVLSRGGRAMDLSSDHRLSRIDERTRIEQAGGVIVANRVNGMLAVSRSFGDVQHKEGSQNASVIATPEVKVEDVTERDEFFVLATDGLWDVMQSQQVVNFVRKALSAHGSLHKAAQELTREALDQDSVDNVSVVLAALHQRHGDAGLRE